MRNRIRLWRMALGWSLALLFCAAVAWGAASGSSLLRDVRQAVYGTQPEQVEAVFSAIREGEAVVEVFAFAD